MEREQLVSMVRALQRGEDGAATAIYEAFQSDIYYFIYKSVGDAHLAEDLTQDTFLEILETVGKLQEPAAFVTWSRQIAWHRCTAHFRKRRELLADEDADGYSVFDTLEEDRTEFIPDEALDQAELRRTVQTMVDSLPAEQRAAIIMRYFDELPVKDIALIQGVSEGTVKSRLNYGRKMIRQSVEHYEKQSGVKLRCAGVVPLLLWLFRQTRIAQGISLTGTTATAAGAASAATAGAVAAGSGTAAAAGSTAAAKAGSALAAKIVAGTLAAAVAVGGTVALLTRSDEPEETEPAHTTQVQEPEKLMFWYGYGQDSAGIDIKRFELTVEGMTDEAVEGHLQVTYLYEITHDSDFTGTGTVMDDGTVQYRITYDSPAVMGTIPAFEYSEMTLIYDPDTEAFSIDQWYYVNLERAVANPPQVILAEDGVWSGIGESTFCWPNPENHEMTIHLESMTETAVRGHITVYHSDGTVEYESDFTGRGFCDGETLRFEVAMESPRVQDIIGEDLVFDNLWLNYDREADTLTIPWVEAYEGTLERQS